MTEKVKVTPKMDELIRNTLKKYERHKIVEKYNSIACDYKNEMDLDTLIKALYIGYEVEPEFKVGDWVVHEFGNKTYKIAEGKPLIECDYVLDNGNSVLKDYLRHATPSEIAEEKERRWWRKHGRDVWELKKGDLLFCNHGGRVHRVMQPNLNKPAQDETRLSDGLWVTDDELKRNWKVACFIKDRLDVKTND